MGCSLCQLSFDNLPPSPQAPQPFPSALLPREEIEFQDNTALKDKLTAFYKFAFSIEIISKTSVSRPYEIFSLKSVTFQTIHSLLCR